MIRNRHTASSVKGKRPTRPCSSLLPSSQNKTPAPINRIISSLERNVKDLKTFYHNR